jgi:hypothetical protein
MHAGRPDESAGIEDVLLNAAERGFEVRRGAGEIGQRLVAGRGSRKHGGSNEKAQNTETHRLSFEIGD